MRRLQYSRLTPLLLIGLLAACQSQGPVPGGVKVGKPYVINGKTYYPSYDSSYDKTGDASWYGPGFHGNSTANGERFDQNDLTAAHPTLPMPSLIRVTNLENNKSAIIRVNDRGPFKRNRIIDLSKKSAETLGIKSIGRVRVQFLKEETEQYIASVKNGAPISMAEFNARAATPKPSQIVEATEATTHAGQIVSDAAPVMTVSTGDLGGSQAPAPAITETTPAPQPVAAREIPSPRDLGPQRLITAAVAEEMPAAGSSAIEVKDVKEEVKKEEKIEVEAGDYVPPVVPYSGVTVLPNETIVEAPVTEEPVTAPVTITPKKTAAMPPEKKQEPRSVVGGYAIQVGSFASEENARRIAAKLSDKLSESYRPSVTETEKDGKTLWRVWISGFPDKSTASTALSTVHTSGAPDARITASR